VAGNKFLNKELFIKIDIGATLKDFSSGVLILEDGTCLTCYKLSVLFPYAVFFFFTIQLMELYIM